LSGYSHSLMKKIEEYREHAEQCRHMASRARDEQSKQQLLQMAETWASLAVSREQDKVRAERLKALELGKPDPE
jgi:hypothetical protein